MNKKYIRKISVNDSHFAYDLSIVIVNHNGWNLLVSCLDSIKQNLNGLRCDIWVVDNGSIDGSVIRLIDRFPDINCIQNEENLGFARANNQAITNCNGRYILLLNNDTIVHSKALQLMIQALENHSELAAVGPQLINSDGSFQLSCMRFPSRWGDIFAYFRPQCASMGGFRQQTTRPIVKVDAVSGACMLLSRNALDQVGLLDEGYFFYAEETDWCYRAHKLGWRVGYVSAARVTHLRGQTAQRESSRFYVERRITLARFKLKHYGYLSARWSAFLVYANIWKHWLFLPTQRNYFSMIRSDFISRIKVLFRQSSN